MTNRLQKEGVCLKFPLNTLGLAHQLLADHVPVGGFCVDATAGKGRDTAFLCSLVGITGRVLAFDIQPAAVSAARALLDEQGYSAMATVVCDSHHHLLQYAQPGTADAIVFNFGWLPGGDHKIFTRAETSIPAIEAGLQLLKPGGVMSLCIYSGGENGFDERDALLAYVETINPQEYTVVVSRFVNRTGNPPIPVFIWKEG